MPPVEPANYPDCFQPWENFSAQVLTRNAWMVWKWLENGYHFTVQGS